MWLPRDRKTLTVATAALVITLGVSASAFVASQAEGSGSGSVKSGTISVSSVVVSEPVVLDVPQQVTMKVTAHDQKMRINHVKVVPKSPGWDARCGDPSNLDGVDVDLPAPIYIEPGHYVYLDQSNAASVVVTLKNDPAVDQEFCSIRVTVTVS